MMNTVDLILESSVKFYDTLKKDENGRYQSWEHCYSNFINARDNKNAELDYLSLQLAFYLASWGMYRGSSFLLQKDYTIHLPVVRELVKAEYDPLAGIDCVEFPRAGHQRLLANINAFLDEYYSNIRDEVKNIKVRNQLSSTLITKILMGTLGCVPAYDRYFISGIKKQKVASGNYNMKSIGQLVDFYEKNIVELENIRKDMKVNGMAYPQMKILDMAFWQIGLDSDK